MLITPNPYLVATPPTYLLFDASLSTNLSATPSLPGKTSLAVYVGSVCCKIYTSEQREEKLQNLQKSPVLTLTGPRQFHPHGKSCPHRGQL